MTRISVSGTRLPITRATNRRLTGAPSHWWAKSGPRPAGDDPPGGRRRSRRASAIHPDATVATRARPSPPFSATEGGRRPPSVSPAGEGRGQGVRGGREGNAVRRAVSLHGPPFHVNPLCLTVQECALQNALQVDFEPMQGCLGVYIPAHHFPDARTLRGCLGRVESRVLSFQPSRWLSWC